jgi:hypothetical protein
LRHGRTLKPFPKARYLRHAPRELNGFRSIIPSGIVPFGWRTITLGMHWVVCRIAAKKETAMTNGMSVGEANLTSSEWSSSKPAGKNGKASSVNAVATLQHDKPTGRRAGGSIVNQALLGGFFDPRSSSLSLAALAQAAAFSGKRLVIEIRDENPVKIVRTSTRGM